MFTPISLLIPISETRRGMSVWVQIRETEDELKGKWEIPGGKIEIGENPRDAGIREFSEEVGVLIDFEDVIHFSIFPFEYKEGKSLVFYLNYFFCDKYPEVKEKLEKQELSWDGGNLNDFNIPAANKEFLAQFLKFRDMQI